MNHAKHSQQPENVLNCDGRPAHMNDCWICNDPDAIVLDSTRILVFRQPLINGHIVLAPKTHAESWSDVSPDERSALFSKIGEIESTMKKELDCEKVYVMSIGDADLHMHFHIVPKSKNSPSLGAFIFGLEGWASKQDLNTEDNEKLSNEIRESIRRALKE